MQDHQLEAGSRAADPKLPGARPQGLAREEHFVAVAQHLMGVKDSHTFPASD